MISAGCVTREADAADNGVTLVKPKAAIEGNCAADALANQRIVRRAK
jgi:hypothetical protein